MTTTEKLTSPADARMLFRAGAAGTVLAPGADLRTDVPAYRGLA
jgi:hypothetical protein